MGVVSTIAHNKFPKQDENKIGTSRRHVFNIPSPLNSGETIPVQFDGTCIRFDLAHPFREVYVLDGKQFKDGKDRYYDSVSFEKHPDKFKFITNEFEGITHGDEGKMFEVAFNFDFQHKYKALCVFDRHPYQFFWIQEGKLRGKVVHSTECQYSHYREELSSLEKLKEGSESYYVVLSAQSENENGEKVTKSESLGITNDWNYVYSGMAAIAALVPNKFVGGVSITVNLANNVMASKSSEDFYFRVSVSARQVEDGEETEKKPKKTKAVKAVKAKKAKK